MNLTLPPRLPEYGPCLLCGTDGKRSLSHVIPKFVIRRIKRTSASPYFRMSADPNRRVQDGIKDYLLCPECEAMFQQDETEFANSIYHPHLDHENHTFTLTESSRRFATSVSWRVASYELIHKQLGQVPLDARRKLGFAQKIWGEYLLDKRADVGPYKQHILITGLIESVKGPKMPSNFNQYLMRGFDLDVRVGRQRGYTYANLAGFLIFGTFGTAKNWGGTLVEANCIIGGNAIVDVEVGRLLQERALFIQKRMDSLSENQADLISEVIKSNPERYLGSETLDAIEADRTMRRR